MRIDGAGMCPASRISSWRAVQEAARAAARDMSERATDGTPMMALTKR